MLLFVSGEGMCISGPIRSSTGRNCMAIGAHVK